MADCNLTNRDEAGCVPLTALIGCDFSVPDDGGFCFATSQGVKDKHGHNLDGDWDPQGHGGCDHRDTAEWRAAHPTALRRPVVTPVLREAEPEEPTTMAETAETETRVTTETVGVDAAVSQMKSLVPHDASPALMIGGAAMLAIVGASIKLGPGLLKARAERAEREHEAKMKELELRERESEKKQDDHGSCATERATLSAKVTAVEAKVDAMTKALDEVGRKVEKAVSSVPQFDEDFDPETINRRLTKLEKAHKAAPKKR